MNNDPLNIAQIYKLTPDEIANKAPTLTPEIIAKAFKILLEKADIKKKNAQIKGLFDGMDKRPQWEAIGSLISANDFFEYLPMITNYPKNRFNPLPPLFIGISRKIFSEILEKIESSALEILQKQASSEPFQHHLTCFLRSMDLKINQYATKLKQTERDIDSIVSAQLSLNHIQEFKDLFQSLSEEAIKNIKATDNALALSWNTSREDLIDGFSFVKESWQKYLVLVVGKDKTETEPFSGLYARLNARLNAVFNIAGDNIRPDTLRDDEPAVEALPLFSIWYVKDLIEVGLISDIESVKTKNQKNDIEDKLELFQQAKERLENAGLKTIGDLKKHLIFSKTMLKEFLSNSQKH